MSDDGAYAYCGSELALFAQARNWKAYWASRVRPHLGAEVLEVGAGIGATTQVLCGGEGSESQCRMSNVECRKNDEAPMTNSGPVPPSDFELRHSFDIRHSTFDISSPTYPQRWVCLEPDARMAAGLKAAAARGELPACCAICPGTLAALKPEEMFDSILYIDVLEHIENDRGELAAAMSHLRAGGKLIVLGPAHPWLYSPFDKALGHFRRYTKTMLAAAVPPGLVCLELIYLDSVGLLASASNRLFLRRHLPSPRQIAIWDRLMVPLSCVVDPLFRYRVGKSVLGVWERR
jgi:hypothetical protein